MKIHYQCSNCGKRFQQRSGYAVQRAENKSLPGYKRNVCGGIGMTLEEAIKILEKKKEYSERIIDNFLSHSRGEIKDANETIEMCDMAISALKEVQQYRKIGTVEECREAMEKQTPKAPDYEGDGYDNKGELIYDTWICPNCGERFEVDYDDYEHCPKCGQAIHQSENLEGMEDE